ncbi:MAG: SpoIIIAH-like family protein [Clostridia bacterium]|nr:SpoIIIAH-like family protein [Clostridia bacterium]
MTFGKRQLVIAALVVALGAAVYLNWQFSGVQPVTVTDTESETAKQLGQTTYVNTEISNSSDISETTSENSSVEVNTSAIASLSKEQQEYFANERIKRSQSQEKAIESLSDIIESASSSETAKQEAVKSAENLALAIKAETDIESEIKTKGFEDCLVSINNDSCSVIVPKGKLDDAAAISIKDIAVRQGGIDYDKITISEI